MAYKKIWCEVAAPTAQFYQEVMDDDGKVRIEHVRAATIGNDRDGYEQAAVPCEVTVTPELAKALNEKVPGTKPPRGSIQEVAPEKLKAHLASLKPAAPVTAR